MDIQHIRCEGDPDVRLYCDMFMGGRAEGIIE